MKLYTYPGNFRAFKALIAAEYAGVSIEVPDFKPVFALCLYIDRSAREPSAARGPLHARRRCPQAWPAGRARAHAASFAGC